MTHIQSYLEGRGLHCVDNHYWAFIRAWQQWYAGKVEQFHEYRYYNGVSWCNGQRMALGMAKTVAEDWANLLLNERVQISLSDDARQAELERIFGDNDFRQRANQLVEAAFALGTAGCAAFLDADGEVKLNYYDASMIWPLSWVNGNVTECAFASQEHVDNRKCLYLCLHLKGENGTYRVENVLLDYETGDRLPLPEGVAEVVETHSPAPRFHLFSPNIRNNIDVACPMGISVYANALDQLKGVDTLYDSYINEFDLGRRRIMVPMDFARKAMQREGDPETMSFDPNDRVYIGYNVVGAEEHAKIEDMAPALRADAHKTALRDMLNLLSIRCGFGTGRWDFDEAGGVRTATEVVSENSDLYQSVCKHKLALEPFLRGVIGAIAELSGWTGFTQDDLTITFDDSIIQDKAAARTNALEEINAGTMSKFRYLTTIAGLSEEEATQELRRIAEDGHAGMDALDVFGVQGMEGAQATTRGGGAAGGEA